jgi:hypothetical protein
MMCSCGKCKRTGLCPVSFGLALGVTSFLSILCMFALAVNHAAIAAPMMIMLHVAVPTMHDGLIFASYGLVKGFLFGLVLALIYDLIICICKCCRGKSGGCGCACAGGAGCGCVKCGCAKTENKPDVKL